MKSSVENDSPNVCPICATSKIVSFNGALLLALVILMNAITVAMIASGRSAVTASIVFVVVSLIGWFYLIDCASEQLSIRGLELVKTSRFGKRERISLANVDTIFLRHDGLNDRVGVESLTIKYIDSSEERLGLGPCWRRVDLEAFLSSAQSVMGYTVYGIER